MAVLVPGAPGVIALQDAVFLIDRLISQMTGLSASDTWTTIKTQIQVEQNAGGA